jgi:hypothetical protein
MRDRRRAERAYELLVVEPLTGISDRSDVAVAKTKRVGTDGKRTRYNPCYVVNYNLSNDPRRREL